QRGNDRRGAGAAAAGAILAPSENRLAGTRRQRRPARLADSDHTDQPVEDGGARASGRRGCPTARDAHSAQLRTRIYRAIRFGVRPSSARTAPALGTVSPARHRALARPDAGGRDSSQRTRPAALAPERLDDT